MIEIFLFALEIISFDKKKIDDENKNTGSDERVVAHDEFI